MAKMGRPSIYSKELAEKICKELSCGMSLRSICEAEDMPDRWTVWDWLRKDQDFSHQYARAREDQAEHYADEMVEIADTTDDPQRAKLQIDARKWKASRMAPRKWGDKITNEVTGPDGGPIILWGSKSE
tara:strand:+ start:926 stop:1312 length:387 start_codon:yes stop_codon:yes gene_type:complete